MSHTNKGIIFFDVDDVLIHKTFNSDEKIAHYLNVDVQQYRDKSNELITTEVASQKWKAIETAEQEQAYRRWFFNKLLEMLNIESSESKIDYMVEVRNQRSNSHSLASGTIETLEYLKSKYQLGIISNSAQGRRNYELGDYDLEKYFDPIIISSEVGYEKPSKEIFEIAINKAKVSAEESALIDDNLENLESAQKSGFGKCVLFNFNKIEQTQFPAVETMGELKQLF